MCVPLSEVAIFIPLLDWMNPFHTYVHGVVRRCYDRPWSDWTQGHNRMYLSAGKYNPSLCGVLQYTFRKHYDPIFNSAA